MENSTLFVIGTLRKIRTAAIGCVDGCPFLWEDGDYDPHGNTVKEGKNRMILTGLKVAKSVGLDTEEKLICVSPSKQPSAESPMNEDDKQVAKTTVDERLLSPEQSRHCTALINERNMYDYVLEVDALSKQQKARILNLTLLGVYSNL
jgi:hypothetical protein